MAEKTAQNAEAKAENAGAGAKAKKATAAEQQIEAARAKQKRTWTVEACVKAAKRFPSEEAWKNGAPSSYKAAMSHGWKAQCLASQTTATGKAKTAARRNVAA